jgi:hypothetical protein
MGASPLFPVFIVVFFLGISALSRNHLEANRSQTTSVAESVLQAGTFLRYREVVTAYAVAHPSWTGVVPATYLASQGINAAVQGQIGHQIVSSAAGRQALVYASLAGRGYEIYRQAGADASIGLVVAGQFQSFNQGTTAALPVAIPNGNVISFVEVGR